MISELSRAAHIYFQHAFRKYHIGHAQIRTLYFIALNEGINQKELALQLDLDKSSITSQLQILERNRYITRKASDEDARKQIIRTTDRTRAIMPSLQGVLDDWSETLLGGFNKQERREIFSILMKMKVNAKNKLAELCSEQ